MSFSVSALGVLLTNSAGQTVYTSADRTISILGNITKDSITTSAHAPSTVVAVGQTDHFIAGAPTGATIVRGYLRVTAASDFISPGLVFPAGGSVILNGNLNAYSKGNLPSPPLGSGQAINFATLNVFQAVTPMIVGGQVIIREQWYSRDLSSFSGGSAITIPALTIQHDLRAARFI